MNALVVLLVLVVVLFADSLPPVAGESQACSREKKGNTVIQAEDADLMEGWQFGDAISGYNGRGYITWVGNNGYEFDGQEKLTYRICVTGGMYKIFVIHSSDYGEDDAYINVNRVWRTFPSSGDPKGKNWKVSKLSDASGDESEATIELDAGCHSFQVAGRSERYSIDQYVLVKDGFDLDLRAQSSPCKAVDRLCGAPATGNRSNTDKPVYVIFTNPSDEPGRLFQQGESGKLSFVMDIPAGQTVSVSAFELDMFVALSHDGDCMRSSMFLAEGGYRHDGDGYESFSIA